MRSVALVRSTLIAGGVLALATAAAQVVSLSLSLPVEHLRVAFTLSSILIQL